MNYLELKKRQRLERDSYSDNLGVRVHRALSWLMKAEQCNDVDSQFTFLWIAFNAAYAQEFDQRQCFSERSLYQNFLEKLVSIDTHSKLEHIVWSEFTSTIRSILDNEYIFETFWHVRSREFSENQWKNELLKAKSASKFALSNNDTATVLSIVFSRLYTLRNQIIHGGATYGSSANRQQLQDCTIILSKVVPIIIELMMDGRDEIWGSPVYPFVYPRS